MPEITTDGRTIDVHMAGRRVALVVDDELIWLDAPSVVTLRHKLMMAQRFLDAVPPEVVIKVPEAKRRWLS